MRINGVVTKLSTGTTLPLQFLKHLKTRNCVRDWIFRASASWISFHFIAT